MASQGIQQVAPCHRQNETLSHVAPTAHKNVTILTAYRKVKSSLSSSASAQDLRLHNKDKNKKCNKEASGEDLENESEPREGERSCKQQVAGWRRFFGLWKKGSMRRMPSIHQFVVSKMLRRKSRSTREDVGIDRCLLKDNSNWRSFTLAQIQFATNNFSEENLIGKGGHAEVYRGHLPEGQLIAIKRLKEGTPEEQVLKFLSEIGIHAHINHPNTAKMIGYGIEGGAFLVLQLSSLGSLSSCLHRSEEMLDWSTRYKIILGIAEGLLYLHENCQRRIIHRDIKADNILLSQDFEPQICDFGLSKWLPEQWSHHNITKFEGTFGYFAPEYFMHGIIDEKTDIFSFGVLLLEIITGREALDESRKSLVLWAKPLLDSNEVVELLDPSLRNNYNQKEVGWVVLTAKMCVQRNPVLRPRMSQVVALIRGGDMKPRPLSSCQQQYTRRTYSEELSYAEEYNSTKHLIDYKKRNKIHLNE